MAAYELTGTIKVVMDAVTFDSGFTKREFVVTTDDDRYPQAIKFECVKDRCALLNNIQPGQRVTVSFDVRGNEHKGRYFVNLSAWKVEAEQAPSEPDASDGGTPFDQRTPPVDDNDPGTPF